MGKVMTKLTLWNNTDLDMAERGLIPRETVRTVEIEALVDTGATMLVIPQEVADALGLPVIDRLPVQLADSSVHEWAVAGSLKVAILARGMICDAFVAPAGSTALIGQIPLERLDLIVDSKSRELRVNPASPDAPLLYALRAAA
jgi:clan AA aspartic protease